MGISPIIPAFPSIKVFGVIRPRQQQEPKDGLTRTKTNSGQFFFKNHQSYGQRPSSADWFCF